RSRKTPRHSRRARSPTVPDRAPDAAGPLPARPRPRTSGRTAAPTAWSRDPVPSGRGLPSHAAADPPGCRDHRPPYPYDGLRSHSRLAGLDPTHAPTRYSSTRSEESIAITSVDRTHHSTDRRIGDVVNSRHAMHSFRAPWIVPILLDTSAHSQSQPVPVSTPPSRRDQRVVYPPLGNRVCPVNHQPSVTRWWMIGAMSSIRVNWLSRPCDLWNATRWSFSCG